MLLFFSASHAKSHYQWHEDDILSKTSCSQPYTGVCLSQFGLLWQPQTGWLKQHTHILSFGGWKIQGASRLGVWKSPHLALQRTIAVWSHRAEGTVQQGPLASIRSASLSTSAHCLWVVKSPVKTQGSQVPNGVTPYSHRKRWNKTSFSSVSGFPRANRSLLAANTGLLACLHSSCAKTWPWSLPKEDRYSNGFEEVARDTHTWVWNRDIPT